MKQSLTFLVLAVAGMLMPQAVFGQEKSKAEIACDAVKQITASMDDDFTDVLNKEDGTCMIEIFPGVRGTIQKDGNSTICLHEFYSGEDEATASEVYDQTHRLLNSCGLEGILVQDNLGNEIADPIWEFSLKNSGSSTHLIELKLIKPFLGPKLYSVELRFRVFTPQGDNQFNNSLDILNNMK